MKITVVEHPAVASRLGTLRDEQTGREHFRRSMRELAKLLTYEATRSLATTAVAVITPVGPATTLTFNSPLLVPVLRAGLGMLDGALELLPDARVAFVGASRNEETFTAETWFESVPADWNGGNAIMVDPMVATAGSAIATAQLLRDRNVGWIALVAALAAPEGVEALGETGLVDELWVASVDERLNERAWIVPGLGDAGDRQFGEK